MLFSSVTRVGLPVRELAHPGPLAVEGDKAGFEVHPFESVTLRLDQ